MFVAKIKKDIQNRGKGACLNLRGTLEILKVVCMECNPIVSVKLRDFI